METSTLDSKSFLLSLSQTETDEKMKRVEAALNSSRLFIADYFFTLRNDIDIKTEEILITLNSCANEVETFLFSSSDTEQNDWADKHAKNNQSLTERINSCRADLLNYLNSKEIEFLDAFDRNIQKDQSYLMLFNEFSIIKESPSDPQKLSQTLDQFEAKLKTLILMNKTILFKENPFKVDKESLKNSLIINCSRSMSQNQEETSKMKTEDNKSSEIDEDETIKRFCEVGSLITIEQYLSDLESKLFM